MLKEIRVNFLIRYKNFTKSNLYCNLKKIRILRKIKIGIGKILWKYFPYKYRLHGDPILQKVFRLIGNEINASSIIETGTFLGASTSLMAEMFPNKKIYTGEINEKNYQKALKKLKKYKNVKLFNEDSPTFLRKLFNEKLIGNMSLFFLDAHWLNNWPLEDEIRIIGERINHVVIFIDDFKVPNNPEFKFDFYENKECSLELITPKFNKKRHYNILFPNYKHEQTMIDGKYHPQLVGYAIIFQNMPDFFSKIKENKFIKKYFIDGSDLVSFKKLKLIKN